MKAEIKNLQGVLGRDEISHYTIPDYQRPFTWDSEVEKLWDDLTADFGTKGRRRNFFLGTLLFAKKRTNAEEIIDGQQRITVIFTILWLLYYRVFNQKDKKSREILEKLRRIILTPAGKDRLLVANRDEPIYNKIKNNEPVEVKDTLLAKAAKRITEWINAIGKHGDILKFADYLITRTEFAVIETEDYLRAWQFFIGLNATGQPLQPSDIIKAFVCGNPQNRNDRPPEIWEEKIFKLEGDATNCLIDLTRAKTGSRVRDAQLFDEFSNKWHDRDINLNNIGDSGEIYYLWWKADNETQKRSFGGISNVKRKALKILRRFDRRDFSPIIIALGLTNGVDFLFNDGDFERVLRFIESFEVRMAIAGRRSRENEFTELANSIIRRKIRSTDQILTELKKKIGPMVPGDKDFVNYVKNLSYKQKVTRKLLLSLEEGDRGHRIIDNFEVEHIIPQTPDDKNYWLKRARVENTGPEYELLINNIGNLAVIDKLTNIECRNGTWPEKKRAYRKLDGWLISKIPDKYGNWDKDKINKRAKELSEKTIKRWPL